MSLGNPFVLKVLSMVRRTRWFWCLASFELCHLVCLSARSQVIHPSAVEPQKRISPVQRAQGIATLRSLVSGEGPSVLLQFDAVRQDIGPLGPGTTNAVRLSPPSGNQKANDGRLASGKDGSHSAVQVQTARLVQRRIEQIAIQIEGPLALTRPDIAGYLDLDADQRAQIEEFALEARSILDQSKLERSSQLSHFLQAMRETGKTVGFKEIDAFCQRIDPQLARVQLAAEREYQRLGLEAFRLLTRRQRARYRRLQGSPFPTDKLVIALLANAPGETRPPTNSVLEPIQREPEPSR